MVQKVIFLDVDGVLNSVATAVANQGLTHSDDPEAYKGFNPISLGLLKDILRMDPSIIVVLSSTWRHDVLDGLCTLKEMEERLSIPLAGVTKSLGATAMRNIEVEEYLVDNFNGPAKAVILDDKDYGFDVDGLSSMFVHVNGLDGFSYKDYDLVCGFFGLESGFAFV